MASKGQKFSDTPGEEATGTENMPGYSCAFCDMRYAHAGDLISHLRTTCADSMPHKWLISQGNVCKSIHCEHYDGEFLVKSANKKTSRMHGGIKGNNIYFMM